MTIEVKPEYESLYRVYRAALTQAQDGKGKERHAHDGETFDEQQIIKIGEWLGSTHYEIGQAVKKSIESTRLPTPERQIKELLGAMNFLAAAVRIIERASGLNAADIGALGAYAGTLHADRPGSKPWAEVRREPPPMPKRCKAVGPFGGLCVSSEHAAGILHEDANGCRWQTFVRSEVAADILCHECLTARDKARSESKVGFLACSRCVDAAAADKPKCQRCHVEDALDHPMAIAGFCGYDCADMAAAERNMRRCMPSFKPLFDARPKKHAPIPDGPVARAFRKSIVEEVLDELKNAPDFEPNTGAPR